jgi:DNA modification methylase
MSGEIVRAHALDLLRSIDAASVQVIMTDPPYGIAYHSNHYAEKNPHAPIARDWNFQIAAFFDEAARALKNGGALTYSLGGTSIRFGYENCQGC